MTTTIWRSMNRWSAEDAVADGNASQRSRIMTRTSIIRIVVPTLALITVAGVALVFSFARLWQGAPIESGAQTAMEAVSVPGSVGHDQRLTAIAAAQAEAKSVVAALGALPTAPASGDELQPAFDVTRIEPSGEAVIAGRAAPGATVELLRNGEVHDRVVADKSGQFVMEPPRLPAGDYELTLRSRLPDGRNAASKQSVVVALQPNLKERPVVALMTPDKPSVVLSKPSEATNAAGGPVAVETVETEPSGKLFVSGRSPPGAAVRLYLNESYLASTTAAANGRFAFTVNGGIRPGGYRVRLDEVESKSGTIRSRAEVPFNMPEIVASNASASNDAVGSTQTRPASAVPDQAARPQDAGSSAPARTAAATPSPDPETPVAMVVVPKVMTAMVSRGDSLWRISRAAYGDGARYTVIYGANHKQIRNPNRIYPGQIFVLPDKTR
jgi:hypothetical protein